MSKVLLRMVNAKKSKSVAKLSELLPRKRPYLDELVDINTQCDSSKFAECLQTRLSGCAEIEGL